VRADLVHLYVQTREPVSSRMLEETGHLGIRSASIRSVMSELERKGLLAQPHQSSGRIPTDDGYRAYVDSFIEGEGLDSDETRAIESAMHAAGEDIHEILRATAGVLGRFSQNIAILAGPREKSPHISAVDLYARDSEHVLIVVTLHDHSVRSELVRVGRELHAELLSAASSFLAERLIGRSIDETRHDLEQLLAPAEGKAASMGARVVEAARGLFDHDTSLQLSFEGLPQALEQPEFSDSERLKSLLELISKADEFERALECFVTPDAGRVSLAIGAENPLPSLKTFSVMATRFQLVDDRYGYLAVLGPCRMRYARMHALIRLIAAHLDRLRG
jgi:heat-inducible transcriptional repressor